jgi:hypothetical protein
MRVSVGLAKISGHRVMRASLDIATMRHLVDIGYIVLVLPPISGTAVP